MITLAAKIADLKARELAATQAKDEANRQLARIKTEWKFLHIAGELSVLRAAGYQRPLAAYRGGMQA